MTSNVGSQTIAKGGNGLGFETEENGNETHQHNRVKGLVADEIKQYFRPEFLNRLDDIILFC